MKKLKFKSVFTKYVIIFMAVIILTAAILGIMVTTIVGKYTLESRQKSLYDANLLFKTTVSNFAKAEEENLEQKLKDNEAQLKENLTVALFGMPECGVIILDNVGNIAFFAYKDTKTSDLVFKYGEEALVNSQILQQSKLSERYMWDIYEERNVSNDSSLNSFFTKSVVFYATAISNPQINDESTEETDTDSSFSAEGEEVIPPQPVLGENEIGVILTFSGAQGQTDMAEEMMNTIILTVVWILIAALIAVYGVTYTVTRPLREISEAAKEFSKGKYDARVPVRGDDELAELAKSFNELATKMQYREEMQNTFLSSASHDLRTPMTTIAGFIDGILDGAIPEDKQEYYLKVIKSEIQRLNRLVTSLLDISRLQSGERKFEMKEFNLCELVSQTVISFENKIEEKKLQVECDFEDFDMMVVGDKDAINQVVYNLCHNALKFSKEGGAYRITIKTEEDKIRFTIYNEGIGISKDDLPFIFDRFYKSDKSRGLDKTGAGLGLFICKTIITEHGEDLTVKSEYEKYCEFTFTLKKA